MRPPFYYRLLIAFIKPCYRLLLWHRRHRLPHYSREVAERFGQADLVRPNAKAVIWCHAVSLGELNTAYPLLKQLVGRGFGLYITSTTQTGFGRVARLFSDEMATAQVVQGFLPIDDRSIIRSFLAKITPMLALFVETELWATTLHELSLCNVPSVMVNARLVDSSRASYQRFAALSASMMANVGLVIVQDERSRQNFLRLGLPFDKLAVASSLKWSQSFEVPEVAVVFGRRTIWTAGSTHAGEELVCLMAHKKLLDDDPNALLILVPRHPERFEEVYLLCLSEGLRVARRSRGDNPDGCQVYLADTMGELLAWYRVCEVAFVGGSLVAVGGHNPIEPAHLGKPVIMGSHTKACQALLDELLAVGAAVQIDDDKDGDGLYRALSIRCDVRAGQAGRALCEQKSGAVYEQLQLLEPYLQGHDAGMG